MTDPSSPDLRRLAGGWAILLGAWLMFAGAAQAASLQAGPDDPWWAHAGAAALLWLHIGGGTVGMLSGAAALAFRKGARLHRAAGAVFFVSMGVTYLIGAGVAPFLEEGQRPNFVAGIMALYLLVTGWRTARQRETKAGIAEAAGLVIALAIAGTGAVFMQMGAASPTGTIDGSPPQAFILFTVAGVLAAGGELNVLLRRGISGTARIVRHLWRMCLSLFIASGSFFLGQM
ncbi:MAG: hypothetical protein ACK4P2_06365, partial [Hyphomonas sp.]